MQNEYVMDTVKKNSEQILENVKNLSLKLQNDLRLNRVLQISSSENYWSSADVYELNQEMLNYGKYIISSYSTVYCYISKTDMVLSEKGIFDSRTFFDIMFDSGEMSYEDWRNSVSSKSRIHFRPVSYRSDGIEGRHQGVSYLVPIAGGDAVLSIIISQEAIFSDIQNTSWGKACSAYLFDTDDRLLLSMNGEGKEIESFSDLVQEHDTVRLMANVLTDTTSWRIVTEVDKQLIFRPQYLLRRGYIVFVLVCTLISIFVIRRQLSKNYAPLNRLMNIVVPEESRTAAAQKDNEFVRLKEAVQEVLLQNSMLTEKSEIQAVKLHKILLEKIIKGTETDSFLMSGEFDLVDILFEYPRFCISVFDICHSEQFETDDYINEKEINKLFQISLGNLVDEVCRNEGCMGEFLKIDDHYCVIINFHADQGLCEVRDMLDTIADKAKEYFDIVVYYTLGNITDEISKLPACYREVLEAVEYKSLFDVRENDSCNEYRRCCRDILLFDSEEERRLGNALRSKSRADGVAALQELYTRLMQEENLSLQSIQTFCAGIKRTIAAAAKGLEEKLSSAEAQRIYQLLGEEKSLKETYNNWLEVLNILNGVQQSEKGRNSSALIGQIKEYIALNYNNPNLSVMMISDEFKLNASYIIMLFKENTSMTLHKYIANYRIEQAVRLMEDTEYTNREICTQVGFDTERTFSRTFKNIMGVSPSKYRRS